jgi:hypothetical protein
LNLKDQTKSNAEKIFVDKITVKCRVYDKKSEIMAVKSLSKFFAQNYFYQIFDDELGNNLKLAFNKLFKYVFKN